jgi:hypothetical protein
MCGIAGFVSTPSMAEPSALNAVRRMSARMGTPRSRLGRRPRDWRCRPRHRRFAILDLDVRANQPWCQAMRATVIFIRNGLFQHLGEIHGCATKILKKIIPSCIERFEC